MQGRSGTFIESSIYMTTNFDKSYIKKRSSKYYNGFSIMERKAKKIILSLKAT